MKYKINMIYGRNQLKIFFINLLTALYNEAKVDPIVAAIAYTAAPMTALAIFEVAPINLITISSIPCLTIK